MPWSSSGGDFCMSSLVASGASAPAARCAKKWFPPATFQLRLRSVSQLVFVLGHEQAAAAEYYYSLHLSPSCDAFYTSVSSPCRPTPFRRVSWSDVRVPVEFGGCQGCVVKVWSQIKEGTTDCQPTLCFAASIALSGLTCIGIHLPPLLKNDSALVFRVAGSHFLASTDSKDLAITRHLFFGPFQPNKVLESYSASLLCRLQRLHRASVQQDMANCQLLDDLERRGICQNRERFEKLTEHSGKKSSIQFVRTSTMARGRDFFDRVMEPGTRITETEVRHKLELARLRIHVRKAEKVAMTEKLDSTREAVAKMQREIDDLNTALMTRLHSFSRDKQGLHEWKQRHNILSVEPDNVEDCSDAVGAGVINFLNRAVQASQYELFSDLKLLYSIQNPKEPHPTIRWIALPTLDRARSVSREETALSVCLGWIAHCLHTASALMDVPLRYPILFRGSHSVILDHSRGTDKKDNEFPLFTKNVDVARTDYAIFLLNKDLAQVRWLCGLITTDLKSTLKNLYELLSLASKPKAHERLEMSTPTTASVSSGRNNSRSELSPDPPPSHHSYNDLHNRVQFYRASMRPPSSPCLRLLSPPPTALGEPDVAGQVAEDRAQAREDEISDRGKDDTVSDKELAEAKMQTLVKEASKAVGVKLPISVESLELQANGSNEVGNGSNSSSSDDTWTQFANRTQALSIQTTFQRKGHKVGRGGDGNR